MIKSGKRKVVSLIGYGSQGRALALNLRDSGHTVLVALPAGSKTRIIAAAEGFRVLPVSRAIAESDTIVFAFPDHRHGDVYRKSIEPSLKSGQCLVFLHGSSIHFGLIKPPKTCDCVLLAPHAPGQAVREEYLKSRQISAFYAVHRNSTGNAINSVFELASAIGIQRKRLVKTTFREEAIGDLFGEQAVLCGGLSMLIRHGFDTLVHHGLKPEHAYLEVAYQLDLIVALVKRHGIEGMLRRISVAARYGSVKNGPRVIGASVRRAMERLYKEVASGKVMAELSTLQNKDISRLNRQVAQLSRSGFERAARKFGT